MFDSSTFDAVTFDQSAAAGTPPPVVVAPISQLALMGVGCWAWAVLAAEALTRSFAP